MPRIVSREHLYLKKARYADGRPYTITTKADEAEPKAPAPPPREEDPAPTPVVTVDTSALAEEVRKMRECVENMTKVKHEPQVVSKKAPESWEFTVHRDRFGKIERVTAKST